MTTRRPLPHRRHCETFKLPFGPKQQTLHVTIGFFDHAGREPGEIFIAGSKSGQDFEAICRDSAILLSLCLQHSVPLEVIRGALTRNEDGTPSTVVGAVVERLTLPESPAATVVPPPPLPTPSPSYEAAPA